MAAPFTRRARGTARVAAIVAAGLLAACLGEEHAAQEPRDAAVPDPSATVSNASDTSTVSGVAGSASTPARQRLDTAVFAGGCFWCMEPPFDTLPGVVSTTSGYTGGRVVDPTYEQVSAGGTGHAEVVRVIFDPGRVSYARLLGVFWRNVDPLTPDAQFCDAGSQYRSAIFYDGEDQRRQADSSKQALARSGRFRQPIVTEVVAAAPFYAAEAYHQDYYTKNPVRYAFYRRLCGRDARLAEVWGSGRS